MKKVQTCGTVTRREIEREREKERERERKKRKRKREKERQKESKVRDEATNKYKIDF